jgi:hypothetical protein
LIAYGQGPEPESAVVTFVIEPAPQHAGGAIAVVGDFNDWDPTRHEFTPGADGRWRVSVELHSGHRYAFRYLAENGEWFDEPDADDRLDNGCGQADCVLDLTEFRPSAKAWTTTETRVTPAAALDLQAIRRRVSAVSAGPWRRHGCDVWAAERPLLRGWDTDDPGRRQADLDAEFVAHARQDVLALLAALEAADREPGRSPLPVSTEAPRRPSADAGARAGRAQTSPARHQLRTLLEFLQSRRPRFRAAED